MDGDRDSWATQQLVEFLASISSCSTAPSAILGAVETAAATLDAEVAAVILGERVEAAIGFPRGELPDGRLLALAREQSGSLRVEGLGDCEAAAVPIEIDEGGWLLVARHEEPLSDEEGDLLRGMGRVLAMALGSVRLLESLHERQELLERLSRLHRAIASRVDLKEVLDAIVEGARELLGDETTGLRLIAPDDPTQLELVSSVGIKPEVLAQIRRSPIGAGVGGRAVAERRLVVVENYRESGNAITPLLGQGMEAAMAAPIYERDRIAGSLVVATTRPGRRYSASEREALTMFAEHAGLALNDARATEETVHQAFHDSLTGLPNRAHFLDRLEDVLAGSDTGGVAVLFADLDGFKTVNDSLGHQAGDELLAMVGERLVERISERGTVARFGGDEFAILLEGCPDHRLAAEQAQRILESFESPFVVRDREVQVTASIGIAAGDDQPDHLLRNADLAMYQAKSRGKGRCESFEPGMHTAVVERLELEADLKRAIDREEILLHYQPIVRLRAGEVVGLEALARWEHPVRGLIEPADFIPLAEESRQILALGRRVLREACRQAAVWQARHRCEPPLQIAVNLSGVQLEQPSLVDEVRTALERASLAPESLMLEITETALMADTDANVEKLQALKDLGVMLAVDDFGTGYSSLDYLRRFPIDVLKIAKSFVDDVGTDGEAPLVRAIVDLAGSFELTVVAEGIERAEQRAGLLDLGCELGQGFHFLRPTDAARMDGVLFGGALHGAEHGDGRPALPVDGDRAGVD